MILYNNIFVIPLNIPSGYVANCTNSLSSVSAIKSALFIQKLKLFIIIIILTNNNPPVIVNNVNNRKFLIVIPYINSII